MAQKREDKKIIRLCNWPTSERPRERLFQDGVGSLSDADLLALFLRSGRQGENVHQLALRLLESSGGLGGLIRLSPQELLKISGLGPAKAATLIAAFEIGKRILQERIARRPLIESAQDLFDLLKQTLVHEREEVFLAVLLNAKNEMLKIITLARGDSTQVIVSVPQVIRQLILEGCAAVLFVHNHPSGDIAPSAEDHQLTQRLVEACSAVEIAFHDHLIIGFPSGEQRNSPHYFSFAEEGFLADKEYDSDCSEK